MARKIRLLWTDDEFHFTELCDLLEEQDSVTAWNYNGEIEYTKDDLFAMGLVLFKDECGVFSLHPNQIVRIDLL